ncbi:MULTISPECIES: hypothetical protein [unclassified Sphingomonas]|jgi:hypothetical protein|uniref:hypothetical protein n=1 Tax=unclassified Sphingomonas TaxID=196159 RepID=UPI00082B07F6|nr:MULTISPECIES: hypothetical protein [unclassified Sphingomonas]MCH4892164.1 hypothetical protein [Sphingomonas sp. SFZ2018-12]
MLKTLILASAALVAAPALAQDTTTQDTATQSPATESTAPAQQNAPAAPTTADSTSAQTSATAQAAGPDQIAQIVETEFPTYDKDSSSDLNQEEFGAWMVALRTASEPGVNAQSAEVKTWTGQAFASADADKSSTVTKAELTSFLSKGQAS